MEVEGDAAAGEAEGEGKVTEDWGHAEAGSVEAEIPPYVYAAAGLSAETARGSSGTGRIRLRGEVLTDCFEPFFTTGFVPTDTSMGGEADAGMAVEFSEAAAAAAGPAAQLRRMVAVCDGIVVRSLPEVSLADAVVNAIRGTPIDYRTALASNIALCGSCVGTAGFAGRLAKELLRPLQSAAAVPSERWREHIQFAFPPSTGLSAVWSGAAAVAGALGSLLWYQPAPSAPAASTGGALGDAFSSSRYLNALFCVAHVQRAGFSSTDQSDKASRSVSTLPALHFPGYDPQAEWEQRKGRRKMVMPRRTALDGAPGTISNAAERSTGVGKSSSTADASASEMAIPVAPKDTKKDMAQKFNALADKFAIKRKMTGAGSNK
jgi:hypothetical protein